jgi:hypothetical protein
MPGYDIGLQAPALKPLRDEGLLTQLLLSLSDLRALAGQATPHDLELQLATIARYLPQQPGSGYAGFVGTLRVPLLIETWEAARNALRFGHAGPESPDGAYELLVAIETLLGRSRTTRAYSGCPSRC